MSQKCWFSWMRDKCLHLSVKVLAPVGRVLVSRAMIDWVNQEGLEAGRDLGELKDSEHQTRKKRENHIRQSQTHRHDFTLGSMIDESTRTATHCHLRPLTVWSGMHSIRSGKNSIIRNIIQTSKKVCPCNM